MNMGIGNIYPNYCEYRGYTIAVERIKPLGRQWNYEAKIIKREPKKSDREQMPVSLSYGKEISDAVERCKEKIDKLLDGSNDQSK